MKKREQAAGSPTRISFDLDEVLFVSPCNHAVEPPLRFPFNRIYRERLRLGTPRLIAELRSMGCEVWIYSSSFRTERYIRSLFRHYKVRLDGIVNGERHRREIQGNRTEIMPSKLPNRYRITLHVDDEEIVCTYGRMYGFQVYRLDAQDDEWGAKIVEQVRRIRDAKTPG